MFKENSPNWKVSLFVITSLLLLLAAIIFIFLVWVGWQARQLGEDEVVLEKPSIVYTDPLIKLANPSLPPVEPVDPWLGSADYRVRIIYFADFLCPYCRQQSEVWSELLNKYPDQIQLVWKDFLTSLTSLPLHKGARCAQLQGAFWPYQERLQTFEFQENQSTSQQLIVYAAELGLAVDDFTACLADPRIEQVVYAAADQALSVGIQSTPAYFINNKYYEDFRDLAEIDLLIRAELGITDEELE